MGLSRTLLGLVLHLSLSSFSLMQAHGQAQTQAQALASSGLPNAPSQSRAGNIVGIVTDRDGAIVPGARVTLIRSNAGDKSVAEPQAGSQTAPQPVADQVTFSASNGTFAFTGVAPGDFRLTAFAAGFALQQISGMLHPGETYEAPAIALSSSALIEVQVIATQTDIAQAQIELEEKQRVLGIFPNFYVSYVPAPAALNTRQKFHLAWRTLIDPVTFAAAGFTAGIQQANNSFAGYGQGAQGYGKRFGAAYGNVLTGTLIGSAILPSLLKQDPRYFYKGTGSIGARTRYALAMSVLCKGDNMRWQVNYSGILGTAASAGISNTYYPAANRSGPGLTLEITALGIASSAVSNIFQEFVIPRLTPHKPPIPTTTSTSSKAAAQVTP